MENRIEVMESVYAKNEELAQKLNAEFNSDKVFSVNVMGAPGVGKTSSLINIIKRIPFSAFVIEGDIESDIDTKKLKALGIETIQINTGGACHLDVPFVADAYTQVAFKNGILFIENIGNLICPAEFMIGEHIKILISSVTEGSDKPYKYPIAFEKADAIILNKCDLVKFIDFDLNFYKEGVRRLNYNVPIFEVSAKTGEGFDEVAKWISEKASSVISK